MSLVSERYKREAERCRSLAEACKASPLNHARFLAEAERYEDMARKAEEASTRRSAENAKPH
jgi:hypothetical protein